MSGSVDLGPVEEGEHRDLAAAIAAVNCGEGMTACISSGPANWMDSPHRAPIHTPFRAAGMSDGLWRGCSSRFQLIQRVGPETRRHPFDQFPACGMSLGG